MKCGRCGIELSEKVYLVHIKICEERAIVRGECGEKKTNNPRKSKELNIQRGLLKAELDRKGIKYHANAKYDYLLKLVNESKEAV